MQKALRISTQTTPISSVIIVLHWVDKIFSLLDTRPIVWAMMSVYRNGAPTHCFVFWDEAGVGIGVVGGSPETS